MNADQDLERRLTDFYATEAPPRAPDRVLEEALATIDTTRQRRALLRVPWRYPNMNGFARYAIAAVAVIAIGAVGFLVLQRGTGPGVGGPAPTATPSSIPSASLSPPPSPSPTSALAPTTTFTSAIHGISVSYPERWAAQAATEPWTGGGYVFGEPTADFLYDPVLTDHLFLTIASQPIGDSTPDEWVAEKLALDDGCAATEPIAVDGATGLIGADDCNVLAVTTDGRGYLISLYTSGDEAWLSTTYDRAWFGAVLATVQFQPEDAVDVAPSSSPGPS
jgi:hypothetical protein